MTPEEQSALEGVGALADPPLAEASRGTPPVEPMGTAAYIAELTGELSDLARNAGLDALAYLLDIAQFEANRLSKARSSPNSP